MISSLQGKSYGFEKVDLRECMKNQGFVYGLSRFEMIVMVIWMGFDGVFSLFYKEMATVVPEWILDLELKLLFVVVKWVIELTRVCVLSVLDIFVEIEWTL